MINQHSLNVGFMIYSITVDGLGYVPFLINIRSK